MKMRSARVSSPFERGGGPGLPLVLLHAFPLSGRMWEPQVAALSGERRIITPDYPGFGRVRRTPAQPDVRYYAEEVRSLLDRLELERVVLGGLSMGGYVAFECLRLFPERIAALVLADTRPDPDTEEMKENRRELARRVAEEGVGVLAESQPKRLLSSKTLEERPEVVKRVKEMILESTPGGVVAALGAMRDRPDSTPLLEEIRIPTLVITGEDDGLSTPEVMGEMAAKIPDSRHVVLPHAGHLSSLENPEGFNAALKELLQSA
ncbi:alpha/beta fold hydrolase [Rubrobacter xylanophilus]|uniref:alpha/beta fold hydrolase n=1 Tax=Rubrobacter xylanophilus TaxID=49319 RepID=UPI001C642196|nr:alpha/beta fold hydrolase [Rubrobacter xylanophilus]